MAPSEPRCVVVDGRISFLATVVQRVFALEGRGASFALLDAGRFKVTPPDVLTDDDRDFLRGHREEVRRYLEHQTTTVGVRA